MLRKVIPAGDYWIDVVAKNRRLRIVDVEGNQSADTLLWAVPVQRSPTPCVMRSRNEPCIPAATAMCWR